MKGLLLAIIGDVLLINGAISMAINSMLFANRGEQAVIVFGILGVETSIVVLIVSIFGLRKT